MKTTVIPKTLTRKKRTKRIKVEKVENKSGFTFFRFIDPPEELIPKKDDIGKYLESADGKKEDYFRLMKFNNDKVVTLVSNKGVTMSKYLESVILHRNENIRNQEHDSTRNYTSSKRRRK